MTPLQARTYVSLLELGSASAGELSRKSEINRVTSYTALDELEQMKLIQADDYDAVRTYRPTSLDNLEKVFINRAKTAIAAYRHVQALLPDLQQLMKNPITDPATRYLEGSAAVARYFEKELKNADVLAIYLSDAEHYGIITPLVKRASEQEQRPRAIIPASVQASLLTYLDHRVVPAKIAQFPATTIISPDRVIIVLGKAQYPQTYVLLDERIAGYYRSMFDLNWRILSGEHMVIPTEE